MFLKQPWRNWNQKADVYSGYVKSMESKGGVADYMRLHSSLVFSREEDDDG